MRSIFAVTVLIFGSLQAALAAQTCDDFKERLDEAFYKVRLSVDLTYRTAEYDTEFLEGLGDARIAIGCKDGMLSQFSGSSYETDLRDFHKLNTAVLIAMGVETSPRKAETIANRVRAAAARDPSRMTWEEVHGFTVQVMHYGGSGGEQFRVDPPSP